MNAEEAFKLFNELAIAKTKTSLEQLEKDVFIGIWEGKTYPQISEEIHRACQTVKEAGPKLFKKINANWNTNVNKKNFKPTIELLLQQYLEAKENAVPQQTLTQVDIPQLVNPFVPTTAKIDIPQLFFNRDKEKWRIFEALNSGSSVALIGERQIGKSSLLLAISQQASSELQQPRQVIYLDLQNIRDEDDFYDALCDAINIETTKGSSLKRELQKQDRRILLLLDEIENIKGDEFTKIQAQLRGLAEGGSAPLRLVVAAKEPLDDLFPDRKGMTSPLAGIFIEEKIGRWNEKTTRGFIASRLKSPLLKPGAKSVNFEDGDIARVIEESGGHPQKLMQLCNRIYADYLEE